MWTEHAELVSDWPRKYWLFAGNVALPRDVQKINVSATELACPELIAHERRATSTMVRGAGEYLMLICFEIV
jgi:hypothetical protein